MPKQQIPTVEKNQINSGLSAHQEMYTHTPHEQPVTRRIMTQHKFVQHLITKQTFVIFSVRGVSFVMNNNIGRFQKESIDAGVIPLCKCRRVCGYNQQRKKGPNQYGWFFCCAYDEHYLNCGFFQWIPNSKMLLGGNLVDKNTGEIL